MRTHGGRSWAGDVGRDQGPCLAGVEWNDGAEIFKRACPQGGGFNRMRIHLGPQGSQCIAGTSGMVPRAHPARSAEG